MALTDVLAQHGIKDPSTTIRAAADAGLELAAACVVLMDESAGGIMEWGHDPVDPQGAYTKGGPVTQQNVAAYLAGPAQHGQRQGCGACQLTSAGYQDRAAALGGMWDPYANQRAGFEGLAASIHLRGVQDGFRAYNGSGPAAQAYGQRSAVAYGTWRQWIGGAPATAGAPTTALPNIGDGDTSALVWSLQCFLNRVFPAYSSINTGPGPTSRCGPQTEAAVTEFQRRSGIPTAPPFGIGPRTWAALEAAGFRP